jgi:hypothetical protein
MTKCPACEAEGERAKVYVGASLSTLLSWTPFYDEDGNFHSDDPNHHWTEFACSRGHSFTEWVHRGVRSVVVHPKKAA